MHMREILAGRTAQSDAIEATKDVAGAIGINPDGSIVQGSKVTIDMRAISSDRSQRDEFIQNRFVLNTGQYPTADFVPTAVQGLNGPLPFQGQQTFELVGNATAHGQTKPMTWQVTAQFDPATNTCAGQATADFSLSQFGVPIPRVPTVVDLQDAGKLVLNFQASVSKAA
jgi:polyisoprenoid-binding protein YceI